MRAAILNIGDELLIGQVTNTNASYIAKLLSLNGINTKEILCISDDSQSIIDALHATQQKYQLVIITGGLGPTKDDITKHTLCTYFNSDLILDNQVLSDIETLVQSKGRTMNELNKQQALIVKGCEVIRNFLGTAPGMILKKEQTWFVSLPGVPFEMKPMLAKAIDFIKTKAQLPDIIHKTAIVFGIAESDLAMRLERWENELAQHHIKLAYLPNRNIVRLRLSGVTNTPDIFNIELKKLQNILGEHVIGFEDFADSNEWTIAKVVVQKLKDMNLTIALAESCTGGAIASAIIKIPGASEVFQGSAVTYNNTVKENIINVNAETLEKYGAVSEQCVYEMAKGAKNIFHSDIAIAVSGIAGPTGGTKDKPIGTVWIALNFNDNIECKQFLFEKSDRATNIELSVHYALAWVLKKLIKVK